MPREFGGIESPGERHAPESDHRASFAPEEALQPRAGAAGASLPFVAPRYLPAGSRIVAAMSGGVDSAVAAALAVSAGYDVVGISMRLGRSAERAAGHVGCCSLDDFEDARRCASALGIPHYVVDLRREFDASVVVPFAEAYAAGRTPNPCALCNRDVKFAALWDVAAPLGATAIATGHYARITGDGPGRLALRTAVDPAKDQSYFLFTLGQEELARTLFPVGGLEKAEVRNLADRLGLPVARKPESQDICFVAGRRYDAVVDEILAARPDAAAPRAGRIVDETGVEVGRHDGVHRFTVGQRRGTGGGSPGPRYVRSIDAASGEVVVAPRDGLARGGFHAADVRWTREPVCGPAHVRLRHRHAPVPCVVAPRGSGAEVRFLEPTPGATPGQAAVWYDGDEVRGGGWIESVQ